MALSGTFQKYPVSQFGLYCEWSGVQSQTDNYTDVTLKVYLHYYTIDVGARSNAIININGTSETYSTSAIKDMASTSWKYKLLKEKTVRVYHNSNGTKTGVTLSASWSFNGTYSGTYVGTITASTSVDLNTIDRSSPTVSAEATVISSTSIKIKGTANKNCNKWEYSLNNGSSWTQYSTTNGTSAEKTLTGLTSSNYTQIKIRATRTDNGVTGTSSAVSADITLPTISFTASNITANSVYINASSSVTADIWEYSINNGSSWTQFSTTAGTSATKTITELTPNTTYQIKVRARKKSNGLYGTSAATSVKTLGATVLNSVNDLTVDVASPSFNINWTVYDKNYTHSLAIKNGSTTIVTITGLTGSAGTNNKTITLTAAQRTSILTAMSAVKELSVSYVLTTYSRSTQIGTSSTAAGTIKTTSNTSKPTFTAFTHLDNNSTTVGVTGNNQLYVQSKSSLRVSCTAATAKNGASIAKYRATIGEKSVESTTTTISFGAIPDAGSLALIVTAIDSRGYETSVSAVLTVISYENIVIESYSIHRENNVESTIRLSFEGTLSSVSVDNVAKNAFVRARYRYKLATASSYGSYTTISGVYSDSSGFSYDNDAWLTLSSEYAYNVQIEVSDKLSTYTVTLYVNKGQPLVSFRAEKVGINTNNPQSALDVNGNIRMNGYGVMGFVAALDSETDLNAYTDYGVWTQTLNASASTDRHYPVTKAGYLEVFTNPSGYVLQRYTAYDCTGVYIRYEYNGSWSAWKTITLS
jgi:hypothetical protein